MVGRKRWGCGVWGWEGCAPLLQLLLPFWRSGSVVCCQFCAVWSAVSSVQCSLLSVLCSVVCCQFCAVWSAASSVQCGLLSVLRSVVCCQFCAVMSAPSSALDVLPSSRWRCGLSVLCLLLLRTGRRTARHGQFGLHHRPGRTEFTGTRRPQRTLSPPPNM